MDGTNRATLRSYLDNLHVHLHTAQWTHVRPEWGETIAAPPVSRFYFFRSGQGWIRHRNELFRPEPGQLFLLPAGQPIAFDTEPDNTFEKYWCHFSATVGDVPLFQLLATPTFVQVAEEERFTQLFQQLIHAYKTDSLSAVLRTKSVLLEILSQYIELAIEQRLPVDVIKSRETGKFNAVLSYIENNLQRHITVEELAGLVHFHPNYFLPYFKSMMGVSPIAYINRKRIDHAKRLLTSTELPMGEIADRVGLEPYYFSRMFKKLTGQAPTLYRADADWRRG